MSQPTSTSGTPGAAAGVAVLDLEMPRPGDNAAILAALRDSVVRHLPGAVVDVSGEAGHFRLDVTAVAFAGKGMLASHKLVYAAIAHLMKGDSAPVHAIDSLSTRAPA